MSVIRNQVSSTNEGEEDTLQRLLMAVALLQAQAEQRQAEAEEPHRQAEERHLEAMRMAKQREEELRQQIVVMKATTAEKRGVVPEEIDGTPTPPNFREIVVEPFGGTQDPPAYLQTFQTQMYISGGNDQLSCKLFLGTLRGVAMHWITTLPARSIRLFNDLAGSFVSQFVANRVKRLEVFDLFDIKQAKGENLKGYLAHFNNATIRKGLRTGGHPAWRRFAHGLKSTSRLKRTKQNDWRLSISPPTRSPNLGSRELNKKETPSARHKRGHATPTPPKFHSLKGEEDTNLT
ncbi:hypothetical protein CR513_43918, partial [Mucuna pruriens]